MMCYWCIISYRVLVLVRCIDTICLQFKILQCVNINVLQIRRNHMRIRTAHHPLSDQSNTASNSRETNGGKIVPIQMAILSTLSNLQFNQNISIFFSPHLINRSCEASLSPSLSHTNYSARLIFT